MSHWVSLRRDTSSSRTISHSINRKFRWRREFRELRRYFDKLRPINDTRHGERHPFVFKNWKKAEHVFLYHDGPKGMLQLPYDEPFTVISRNDKNFIIRIHDKSITVSIYRIKPTYLFSDSLTCLGNYQQPMAKKTDSTKREAHEDNERVTDKKNQKFIDSRSKWSRKENLQKSSVSRRISRRHIIFF